MATTVEASPSGAPLRERSAPIRKRLVPYALLAPGALWLAGLFVVPIITMVFTSLKGGGLLSGGFRFSWEFSNYADGISLYGDIYLRTLGYAAIVTVATLLIAYPMTYWIAFYGGRNKNSFLLLLILPFFVSFVIRTIQWQFILNDGGLVLGPLKNLGVLPDDFHVLATPVAVIAGITYNFLPFTALPVYVALERIDKRLVEAAKDLYASRFQAFWRVVFPLSIPGVFAAFLLTFVPTMGDYVNATVLGGPGTTMIGNVIQSEFLTNTNYPLASALSFILMGGLLVLATIYARVLGTEDVAVAR